MSEEQKTIRIVIYHKDSSGSNIIDVDTALPKYGIDSGSMSLEEVLCDGDLTFGAVGSSKFECKIFSTEDAELPASLVGYYITVDAVSGGYYTMENGDIVTDENSNKFLTNESASSPTTTPLFRGIIDSSKRDNFNNDREIVAYDMLYSVRDKDVSAWLNSATYTKDSTGASRVGLDAPTYSSDSGITSVENRSLYNKFLDYLSTTYGMSVTKSTSNYAVNGVRRIYKYGDCTNVTVADMLRMFGEMFGCFFRMSRDGILMRYQLSTSAKTITKAAYEFSESAWEDYQTYPITGVAAYDTSEKTNPISTTTAAANGANPLIISGNLLYLGHVATWGATYADVPANTLLEYIQSIVYYPCELKLIRSDFSYNLGDLISCETVSCENTTTYKNSYIMSQTFSGSSLVEHTIHATATGQFRSSDSGSGSNDMAISNIVTAEEAQKTLQQAINDASANIVGEKGGYLQIVRDSLGYPNQLRIMNAPSYDKSTSMWVWTLKGLSYVSRAKTTDAYSDPTSTEATIAIDMTGHIHANYITTGTIQDTKGYNYWDLNTGEFKLSSSTTVGGETVSKIATDVANTAANAAETNAKNYTDGQASAAQKNAEATAAEYWTQTNVFNTLTNNGELEGIYMQAGKLYINATYIKSGSIAATYINTKGLEIENGKFSIKAGTYGSYNVFKATSDVISLYNNHENDGKGAGVCTTYGWSGGSGTTTAVAMYAGTNSEQFGYITDYLVPSIVIASNGGVRMEHISVFADAATTKASDCWIYADDSQVDIATRYKPNKNAADITNKINIGRTAYSMYTYIDTGATGFYGKQTITGDGHYFMFGSPSISSPKWSSVRIKQTDILLYAYNSGTGNTDYGSYLGLNSNAFYLHAFIDTSHTKQSGVFANSGNGLCLYYKDSSNEYVYSYIWANASNIHLYYRPSSTEYSRVLLTDDKIWLGHAGSDSMGSYLNLYDNEFDIGAFGTNSGMVRFTQKYGTEVKWGKAYLRCVSNNVYLYTESGSTGYTLGWQNGNLWVGGTTADNVAGYVYSALVQTKQMVLGSIKLKSTLATDSTFSQLNWYKVKDNGGTLRWVLGTPT